LTDATGNYINGATGVEQASMVSIIGGIKRERFSMGVSVNGLHHRIFDLPSSAISLSGGINLSVVPGKLRAGLSIINAGRYHKGFYSSGYELSSDLMPTTGRAGVLWKDTLRNILPVIVYIDAVYEKNYDLVTVPVGVELSPIPYLALRIGKCFFLETELFTSGIGIKWENLSFDASFVPYSIEEETFIKWSVALRYELKRKKQTKESTSQIKIQKETIITPVEEKNDTIFSLPKADTSESDRSKVEEDTLSKSSIKTGEDFNKKEPQQNSLQSDTARAEDSLGVEVPENKTENIREQNFSSPHNKNLPLDTLDVPSKKEDISPLDTLQRENLKKAE
ncbi:MAG: hypothetical protein N2053_11980, partial [Chitinispirillaceae bacterium]|nr:hypothetical protein [Chitinispirillaceae bacterium]